MAASTERDFSQILKHLHDTHQPFPAAELYHFSDLNKKDSAALEAAWPDVPVERRRGLVQDLGEISEANFEVTFEAVFRLGLEDEDAEVRATSIRSLWEVEEPDLIAPLIDFLQHDPDANVRAAAASALGRFVYLGELEEIPPAQAHRVEDELLASIRGPDDLEVRRRALEAIGFSSRPEVAGLIREAYTSSEPKLRVSSVFAMGRSADIQWASQVCAELEDGTPEMRFEAARAAGELELAQAVPGLEQLIEDGDPQVREAAIWSLGQVGGDRARQVLTDVLEQADEDEQDFIQEALDNLAFNDDLHSFSILAFDEDDDPDDGEIYLN